MLKRRKWTRQEDEVVVQVVASLGCNRDWMLVAEELQRRGFAKTPRQVKARWVNNLDASINKAAWTSEDLDVLFDAFCKYGNKWLIIASRFVNRTDCYVKNQFFSATRRALRIMSRYSQLMVDNSSTKIINAVKPKILAEFLSKTVDVERGSQSSDVCSVKTIDIVSKFAIRKNQDSKDYAAICSQKLAERCISMLLEMNNAYMDMKTSKMPRRKKNINTEQYPRSPISGEDKKPHEPEQTTQHRLENNVIYVGEYDYVSFTTEESSTIELKKAISDIREVNLEMLAQLNNNSIEAVIANLDQIGSLADNIKNKLREFSTNRHDIFEVFDHLKTQFEHQHPSPDESKPKKVESTRSLRSLRVEKRGDRVFSIQLLDKRDDLDADRQDSRFIHETSTDITTAYKSVFKADGFRVVDMRGRGCFTDVTAKLAPPLANPPDLRLTFDSKKPRITPFDDSRSVNLQNYNEWRSFHEFSSIIAPKSAPLKFITRSKTDDSTDKFAADTKRFCFNNNHIL